MITIHYRKQFAILSILADREFSGAWQMLKDEGGAVIDHKWYSSDACAILADECSRKEVQNGRITSDSSKIRVVDLLRAIRYAIGKATNSVKKVDTAAMRIELK